MPFPYRLSDRGTVEGASLAIEAGDDARATDFTGVARIVVAFPKFRDGRGYSVARTLRERGYPGELVAAGPDLGVDQFPYLKRAGFDAVETDRAFDPAAAARALGRHDYVYQHAADGRPTVWELRHG